MGVRGYFSHHEPAEGEPPCDPPNECHGRDPFARIAAFGHTGWTTAGENIAAGYVTAAQVFEGWRTSPGHDANMRHAGFTAIGIGRVEVPGSPYRVYWTTDFSDLVDGEAGCDGIFPEPPNPVGPASATGGGDGGCSTTGGDAAGAIAAAAVALALAARRRRGV
jgi:MYXO-CTERM domain-containing protein